MRKEAALNIKLSSRLYEAVKAEAARHHVSTAAYVRAVLARQIYGKKTVKIGGQESLLIDWENGAYLLDMYAEEGKAT